MKESISKILLKHFEEIPFHNFKLILKEEIDIIGGTCSDKTLLLKQELDSLNVISFLHSAEINGHKIHRLLKIFIDDKPYFLDVGLGWPLTSPLPLYKNSEYFFYGLYFKSIIENDNFFLHKKNKYNESYKTNITTQNEEEVMQQIKTRFYKVKYYPFNNSIRYSQIVDGEFYFLKGNILGYSKNKKFYKKEINKNEFIDLFEKKFKIKKELPIEIAIKTNLYNFKTK